MGSRDLVEAEAILRGAWDLSLIGTTSRHPEPVCFAMETQLAEDLGSITPYNPTAVVTKTRECGSFVVWQQGYSPKEHKDRVLSIEAAKIKAEEQRKLRRSDRLWQLFMLAVGAILGYLFGRK